MAHFCRLHFSLGLKRFISFTSNFRCASNLSFRPFSFFVGAFPSRFSNFSVANIVKNLRYPTYLNNFLLKSHKIQHFFIQLGGNAENFDYFCNCILQRVQNILLTFRYELPPLNRIDRARLLSKECTHNSVGSPLDNRGCGRPVAEMAVCAVSVSRGQC